MTTPLHLEILCRVYNRGVANAVDAAESHAVDDLRNLGLIEQWPNNERCGWRTTDYGKHILVRLETAFIDVVY